MQYFKNFDNSQKPAIIYLYYIFIKIIFLKKLLLSAISLNQF